ncbi:hypothetical protein JCM33374_g3466 [Metschnikowia sp. JCM 33374]|nr:hypothetical protein JCM33374_g3466 [Metschnikowia sp. JCM 33374]
MPGDEADINLVGEENIEESIQDWGSINRGNESLLISQDSVVGNDESLPKRSEKFFDQDGSDVQQSRLDHARDQMYLALSHIRGHHAKQLLVGVWIPSENRAFIPHAKGSFFKDMGTPHIYKAKKRLQGLWLNEIEAVYLTERGSLVMYLANDYFLDFMDDDRFSFDYETLTHLSLAHLQAFAFSVDSDILDKYHVFALLKRLGYSVMEFRDHSSEYAAHEQTPNCMMKQPGSLITSAISLITSAKSYAVHLGTLSRMFCASLLPNRNHYFNFTQVFQSLAFSTIHPTSEVSVPPHIVDPRYRIVFNVWKPSPKFSKKNPPRPDFQLGVLNTSKVKFPDLSSIQASWNELHSDLCSRKINKDKIQTANSKPKNSSFVTKKELNLKKKADRESKLDPKLRERNNYLKARDKMLKQGSTGRSTVFAIIDDGIVNFTMFNETDFRLRTQAAELNKLEARVDHGIVWNEKLDL